MKRQRTMVQQARAYLQYRRALGFELRFSGKLLIQFAKFVDRSGWRGPLTTDLILRWVNLPKSAAQSYKANRLSIARSFARYLAARDGQTQVPDWRLMPKIFRHRPHLFGEPQLRQLIAAARRLKRTYPLRPLTYETLFGLLASTGLRICEALKLTCRQVDLERGTLRIERTKFKKSRLVPLHPTTTEALRLYAAARVRRWGRLDDGPFSSVVWEEHCHTIASAEPSAKFALNSDGRRAMVNGLGHGFMTCATALPATVSYAGIATVKTLTARSPHSQPIWATAESPTRIGTYQAHPNS